MRRLSRLVWKEFLELRQNPRLFGIVIVAPIVQLTMLGYAATTDVKEVPIVVADGDRSPESRSLIARFDVSTNFAVIDTVTTVTEVDSYLQRGRAWIALAIPRGYGARIHAGTPVALQVVADGSDSNSTTVALGYATSLVGGYAEELMESSGSKSRSSNLEPGASDLERRTSTIDARIRIWFNPQLESRFFMIPGVLALLLLLVTANLAAMAIVREKELGTLEQLNVTPLRRWELIVGKLLPYGVIALIDVLLVTAVAVFWFEVPLRGSLTLLLDKPGVRTLHACARPVHLDNLRYATTGHDDGDVLLPDTDDLPLRLHLPDREHATHHSVRHLLDPAPVLSGDRPRNFLEGDRAPPALAPDRSAGVVGHRRARSGCPANPEERRLSRDGNQGAPTTPRKQSSQ